MHSRGIPRGDNAALKGKSHEVSESHSDRIAGPIAVRVIKISNGQQLKRSEQMTQEIHKDN